LPAQALVVMAGRAAPDDAWRSDGAWQPLLRVLPLETLSDADSRYYLGRRGVAEAQHDAILAFARGYPLALSLAAELAWANALPARPTDEPDLVRALLARLVDAAPSAEHRMALELCALARNTTESLLASVIGGDAHALFTWLRELPFVRAGQDGLFPHDLV